MTMEEVVEELYNKECNGKIVIDDTIKQAIDAFIISSMAQNKSKESCSYE